MVTLNRSQDAFSPRPDLADLVTGIGAMMVALVVVTGIGMGIAGCATGRATTSAIDSNQTVTYKGQVFGDFQPDGVNDLSQVTDKVSGKPLATDEPWNLIPPRKAITINGVPYADCTGEKPFAQDGTRYRELICARRH